MRPRFCRKVLIAGLVSASILLSLSIVRAADLPAAITDQEFWRLVTNLSEPGGVFQQEVMSNEDSAQFVIPELKQRIRRGGVYIGVGPEQNFTYLAAIQPTLAFVVDIRRDNLVEHLLYKALFELSADRADFVARLFSRPRPARFDAGGSATALFDAYQSIDVDPRLYDTTLQAVIEHLKRRHAFQLSDADETAIGRLLLAFRTAGPSNLKGSGDKNLTYAQAMTATDLDGHNQSYLASDANFRIVQDLERRNLVVPVVGDFAGDQALAGIGRYLTERQAIVNVFYVSNVERYLFEQGEHGRHFYANVAALPLDQSSTFIRSVTRDISRRLGIPLPDGNVNWWSFLSPIRAGLDAIAGGRVETYRQLFEPVR